MPTVDKEIRYIGENNPLRLELTEASGQTITLASYSIAFYDASGNLVESFDSTNNSTLFSFSNNVLFFYWNISAATYSPGTYYAYWTYTTATSPAETYITKVKIEVRAVPDLA